MVDIDDFKAINDRYGHTCGDEALRKAAARLDELVRASDRVGRYGGDEFLIILPDTTPSEADAFVKRMRAAWDAAPPCLASGSVPICVSFGCACVEIDDGVVQLVRRADEAMYRDKRRLTRGRVGSTLG
jgi:diguanylate cyclase (GGDEF)-like protein